MSRRVTLGVRWLLLGLLTGGVLLQSACATSLASGTSGLITSITNQLVSNLVYKAFGIPTYSFSLGT